VIAILIIFYVAVVLVLFKVLRLKPTAYLIAALIVAGVFMIGGRSRRSTPRQINA
jgi:membrane fusion protein (multidrug efflux system)